MSSFNMKITNELLKPPVPPQKKEISLFDIQDQKDTYSASSKLLSTTSQHNHPTGSSTKGMAIRIVRSSQEDHL
jgi:hypothetical protein